MPLAPCRPAGSGALALALAALVLAPPCNAETPAVPTKASLTVPGIVHNVECPNPKREICVIRKPVGSGYRMLTRGVSFEDTGDYWLADFSRPEKPNAGTKEGTKGSAKDKVPELESFSFRVMGKDNDIHQIDIRFSGEGSRQSATPTKKPAAAGKSSAKKKET